MRVPHAQGVSSALRSLRGAATKALKGLNQTAAQRMAKGDYAAAEAVAAKGREIRQFQREVEELRKRWREIRGTGGSKPKSATTPLWAYYQPILQGLVEAGGEALPSDLERLVERIMATSLQPGDKSPMAGERERWRVMLRRARKALIAEGWIEDGNRKLWEITDSGRRAAEKPITGDPRTSK
jgi:Mrr restriction endonuclease-like protein